MKKVRIRDKYFEPYITQDKIMEGVERVAADLNKDLKGKQPIFLSVLNGSFLFAADLMRKMEIDCEISFVKLASYHGTTSTGTVKQLVGLNEVLEGRYVVVVEDIVDTGTTIKHILNSLKEHHPADIRVATLLFKPDAYKEEMKIHHYALKVPNDFLVGYGLDYDGLGRNLKDIYKLSSPDPTDQNY